MPVISIRVSDEWLAYVDAEAERCRWKRNAAVVNLTWDGLQVHGALGEHHSDSIEPQSANGNVGMNAGMDKEKRDADKAGVGDGGRGQVDGAVRTGLAGGGQGKRSEDNRKARKGGAGNLTVRGPDTAGDAPVSSTNCPSCGGMNGLHQRGCKG